MSTDIDSYYLEKDEPDKSCLLTLRECMLRQDKNISETLKWGMPCFIYKNKIFCYLSTDKKTKEPYLLMVEGKHLNHPELEKGQRSRMKILRINPNIDLPIAFINALLNEALDLYRLGIIKTK
ncbi:DUF1801 domain-containing protein [Psychroserpens sp. NJDZ02]|uniref:DUF1801 domain-containing protein n=1 Tax=Psychroserpens sp. NJDZ02 TaxID=2570561 RepID=UPI0010A8DB2C|nr:DUF1801 domain-containing protein [Psychroserpens sp. NJDZ02]QCE43187.1 DUF1801 domain-containing protein [Psychroserpens sp. NJDZ02]